MNNDIYLHNLCSDCVRSANKLTIAIQRAWDNTVDEFERDMSTFIEQNPLKYNLLERAQFVFQMKGNGIAQQIISRSKAVDKLLDGKLNAFEQQVIMLIQDERQSWLSQNAHRDRMLRTREPQLYQEFVEYLTEGLQLQNVSDITKFADPLCELIATYVFISEYPLQADLIQKELCKFRLVSPAFFCYVPTPPLLIYLEMMKRNPEAVIMDVKKEVLEQLHMHGNNYVLCACRMYGNRVETVQKLIEKKVNLTLNAEM